MKKLIAITTNGSNVISLVKSVDEQEYKALINNQAKDLAKRESIAKEHEEKHASIKLALEHLYRQNCVRAKSVYDNFVDRGLIENDESFQKKWFDFYFSNEEIKLKDVVENAPIEYTKILERLGNL